MNEDRRVGQIKIFTFQNPEALSFDKGCNCFTSSLSNKEYSENNLSLNNDKIMLQGFLELSNVMIVQEQVNYLELIRFYNLIYDTITRLDPSFSGVYKTHIYDPKYVDSLNVNIK
nr:flagellar basal body rod protein [Leptospira weilii]